MWPGPYGQGGGSRKHLLASLDQSLARMGPEYVDISSYDASTTRAMAALLAQWQIPLLIHQPRYNLFDRAIEKDVLAAISSVGAGASSPEQIAENVAAVKAPAFTAEELAAIDKLAPAGG